MASHRQVPSNLMTPQTRSIRYYQFTISSVKNKSGIDKQQNLQADPVEVLLLRKPNVPHGFQTSLCRKPPTPVMRATRLQLPQENPPFSFHQRDQGRNPEATKISQQQPIVAVSAKPPSARRGHDYLMNFLEAKVEVYYDVSVTSGQKNQ